MAYVGRRVEVYWPPDEDLAEGTWYRGIVDRYEQLKDGGGRGGYHVAYDDGDEEMLGEIDCRSDVRLLDSPRRDDDVTSLEVDNPESHDGDSAPRSEANACHNHPEEIPTAGTSSGEENDIENHGSSPLEDPSVERLINVSRGEHQASSRDSSETGESYSEGRSNGHCGPSAAARDALESRNIALSEATTRRETEQSSSPSGDGDGVRLSDSYRETSESVPTAEIEAINEGMVTGNYSRIAPMSHEEQCQCLGDTAVAAPESEFSGDSDDDSTMLFRTHSGGEGGSYGNSSRSNRSEGTGPFSLSTDSSDWTPLRGSEFLGQSPARRRDDWSSSSATKEVATRDRKAVTNGIVSALRDALDASAGVDVKGKPRGYNKTSPAMMGGKNGCRSGGVRSSDSCCEYQGTAAVDLAGRRDESVEMEALGDLIRHSATVSGAVEGVEGRFSGGVFVKVSFLDGGREPPTTDAMFRCKTLVHTTGSTAAGASSGENSWPKGEFQFQVSHGGRVIELANAAVLFSVHRRIDGSGTDSFKRNDSFLGQILLPLRGALDNLRLLAFEDKYRAAPQDGPMGNQTVDSLAALVQHNGTIPGEGGGNDSQKCVKHWRLLQGAISGVYPVADRRGRVSHTEREGVSIRLRLSVSLPLKKPASLMDLATQARAASGRPTVGVSLGRGCGSFGACQGRGERALRHRTSTHGSSAGNATGGKGGHSSPRKLRTKIDCRYCHPPAVVPRRESLWIKRQREIARENERMECRLKAIREAAPRHNAALDKIVAAKGQERRNHRQRRGRDEGQTTAPRGMGNSGPTREGLPETAGANRCDRGLHVFYGVPGKGAAAQPVNGKAKNEEEVRRGALYKRRKALALATEKAATEAAEVRARVDGLRIKTSWTEMNARRAALAVASLQKALARRRRQSLARGGGGREKLGQRGERGNDEKGGEADERVVAVPGRFTSGVIGPDIDVADEELADELRRQEELHKALLGKRQKAVARTERSRQAREVDLKALEDVRAQLAQAEARQARYMWRRRETSRGPSNPSGTSVLTTETLPKDAFEEAQDLVLLLRTEVETLRLAEAIEEGLAKPSPVNGDGDSEQQSRAAREALEEVASLNSRLEDKKRRLEAISVRRDAIRTEYQNLVSKGRRFELKESLGWLEHASLLLSRDSHLK